MADKRNKYVFFVIFIILGVLLALQFRSTLTLKRQKSAAAINVEMLRARISEEMKINEELKAEIEENILKRNVLLKSFVEDKNDLDFKKEWESTWVKANFTDVSGPGIIIKLDDAAVRQENDDPLLLIIHDQDIRHILNELKKAGAQAISINGERIVPMSEQVCAGPTILINKNRYAVPYVISAIGDPDQLYDTLMKDERVALMIADKIRIEIKKSKDVFIPKFRDIEGIDRMISGLEVVSK